MFEFFFKYPRAVFSKGDLVLLGAWPWWVLVLFMAAAGVGLAWLVRSKVPRAAPHLRNWKSGLIWMLQFALAALGLLLLWQAGVVGAGAAVAVAAGGARRRAPAEAEYYRGPGGRFAQHEHRGQRSDPRAAGRQGAR